MAASIEHRTPDSVVNAYEYFGYPNFSIHAGRDQRDCYTGANMEDGAARLSDFLEMIKNSGTATVYTIRVYPADVINITSKTPHNASTSFMLKEDAAVTRDPNSGLMILDRSPGVNGSGNGNMMQMMMNMMKQQQEATDKMFAQMLAMQQQRQETKLDKFIGYVEEKMNNPAADKDIVDKIGEIIEKNPNVIKETFSGLRDIFTVFIPGATPPAAPVQTAINGTQQHAAAPAAGDTDTFLNQHNAQTMSNDINELPDLTEAEMDALADRDDASLEKLDDFLGPQGTTAFLEQITNGNQEQFENWIKMQNALTRLVGKVGPADMLAALNALADMNTIKLKGLLAMM